MFEIFDPGHTGFLERPDVGALYRMLYDSDYEDDKLIDSCFKFNENGAISRGDFIAQIKSNRNFIKPATSFQGRVRGKLGGLIMWEALTSFRKRNFAELDESSTTLDQALERILQVEVKPKPVTEIDLESAIMQEKALLMQRAEAAKRELLLREEEEANKKEREALRLDNRPFDILWTQFQSLVETFEATVFNIDRVWDRQEKRNEIFAAFDLAMQAEEEFFKEGDNKEREAVCPNGVMSEADKEARLKDFLQTEMGKEEKSRQLTLAVLRLIHERLIKRVPEVSFNQQLRCLICLSVNIVFRTILY